MRTILLLSSGLVLAILNSGTASGQRKERVNPSVSPFSQGDINIELSTGLNLNFLNLKDENNFSTKQNNFGFNYTGTYFIIDNVGVGLGITSDISREKINEIEVLNSSTTGSLHAMYGKSVGSVINIYGKAAVRKGRDRYEFTTPIYTQDSKKKLTGFNFEIGVPIDINEYGFYGTPYIAYDYSVYKDDNHKDKFSGFHLGTKLNLSLPCGSFARNCSQVEEFSDMMYTQGTSIIGGYTGFRVNFGNETQSYTGGNGSPDTKNSFFGGKLKTEYFYYLFDDIALGGDFRFRTSGYNFKETENKQNDFSWMIMPKLQVNLPVTGKLHNTFGFIGYGIGGSTNKSTYSGQTNETKESRSSLEIGAGYNIFFAERFSLVPMVNYTWSTSKNKETDLNHKSNGLEMNFSIRHSF